MTHCPMCGHACYRTPERPDWSCPYHGRVNLLQAKMEKHTMETGVDYLGESISWELWKLRCKTVNGLLHTRTKELRDLQAICGQFVEGIDKLGIS